MAAIAVAAALVFGPAGGALTFLGLAAIWSAGAMLAFRHGVAVPLVEPLVTAIFALGATIGYRLIVAERIVAAQIAQERVREAEMASAAAIQRAMLPSMQSKESAMSGLDIFAHMTPAREVGGDLYDVVKLDEKRLVITIGDVCDKGIPAALFMAITQTIMRLEVHSGEDLQAEIGSANKLLVANNRERMYTTLFCGVLDASSGRLTYCNCGHNPPLILRRDGGIFESLASCGPPLGIKAAASYVPGSAELAAGDILVLYTDGVTEAETTRNAQFGMERLQQTILAARGQGARGVVERILASVAQFTEGAPQSDDITCVAVVRNEKPAVTS
jgi:sigma-B regulation protein RsbU (phosphoserine phosphatase)